MGEEREFAPDWSVHPGAILRAVLERRGIRQADLAERTGLTPKHVNQIVKESVGVSGDVAVLLERALGVPATFWTRADADYATHVSKQKARRKLAPFVDWADRFDAATLRRHGVIDAGDPPTATVEKILTFFEVASPQAFDQRWLRPLVSFRRSQVFTVADQNTALWLRLVQRAAERLKDQTKVGRFGVRALRSTARTLPAMTTLGVVDGFLAARAGLAQAGVLLVFVREVPQTRMCGATTWLDAETPVIGLTERHRKPDILWFSIAHEIGHLLLHAKRRTFLNLETDKEGRDGAEEEADSFAEHLLLPPESYPVIAAARSREELAFLSAKLGVGAPVVAGKHGHLTGNWTVGASMRGKVSNHDIEELEKA